MKCLIALACLVIPISLVVAKEQNLFILSRGSSMYLTGYAVSETGAISTNNGLAVGNGTPEGWLEERRVLSYARREKILVFGLLNELGTARVLASGHFAPPQYFDYPGTRIDCVEVVERGDRTFVYAGQNEPDRIYGYELAQDGALTALPGFPFSTNTDPADLLQIDGFLYSAETGNNFISAYKIGSDGTLFDSILAGDRTRPPFRTWQIEASPDKSTLFVNSDNGGSIQLIQRDPKKGGVIFNSLVPYSIGSSADTVIAAGKKLLAVADGDDTDGVSNVRLFKMGSKGRLEAFSDSNTGSTNVSDNKFMAFVHNDKFLLVVSEAEQELRVLSVDKKAGLITGLADALYLGSATKLATMLVIDD